MRSHPWSHSSLWGPYECRITLLWYFPFLWHLTSLDLTWISALQLFRIEALKLCICRSLGVIDVKQLCFGLMNLVSLTRWRFSGSMPPSYGKSRCTYRLSQTAKPLARLSELRRFELHHCELRTSIKFSQWPSLQHLNLESCRGHVVRPAEALESVCSVDPLQFWFSPATRDAISHRWDSSRCIDSWCVLLSMDCWHYLFGTKKIWQCRRMHQMSNAG